MKSRFLTTAIISLLPLFIPLITMQFTSEVYWTLSDFLIGGALLLVFGQAISLAALKLRNMKYRVAIVASIVILFALVWAELAVGIFGTPFAGS